MMLSVIQRKRELHHLEQGIRQIHNHVVRSESLPPVMRQSIQSHAVSSKTALQVRAEVPRYLPLVHDPAIVNEETELAALLGKAPEVEPSELALYRTRMQLLRAMASRKERRAA